MSNIKVDTKGLDCPLPLIKLKEVLAKVRKVKLLNLNSLVLKQLSIFQNIAKRIITKLLNLMF